MKQIGARQEAGRIGGTGPCGRELCCATWMKSFSSVSTNAARIQDISPNPQKLAGMCAKLKCCLNYEVDQYVEAGRQMPPKDAVLQAQDSDYYLFKTDILAGLCTYSTDKNLAVNLETITASRAKEIIIMNRKGAKPVSLLDNQNAKEGKKSVDLLADADVSRFDKAKKKKKGNNQQGKQRQVKKNGNGHRKPGDKQPAAEGGQANGHSNKQGNGGNNSPSSSQSDAAQVSQGVQPKPETPIAQA